MNYTEYKTEIIKGKHGELIIPATDNSIGSAYKAYGEYSEIELIIIKKILKAGDFVFDIGANIGIFSIPISKQITESGKLFCFEPQKFIFNLLNQNIEINKLGNVNTFNCALGEKICKVKIDNIDYSLNGNFGGVGIDDDYDNSMSVKLRTVSSEEKIEMKKLDQFINIERCDFIKIDVEKMETKVLKGGENFIKKFRPVMWIENHLEFPNKLNQYLLKKNYKLYWSVTTFFNPCNYFLNSKNIFGDSSTVNVLAIPSEKNEGCKIDLEEITSKNTQATWSIVKPI